LPSGEAGNHEGKKNTFSSFESKFMTLSLSLTLTSTRAVNLQRSENHRKVSVRKNVS
jgi:hypothetical protein